jgi:hypothetical protein
MFLKSMDADSPSHPCYEYWTHHPQSLSITDRCKHTVLYYTLRGLSRLVVVDLLSLLYCITCMEWTVRKL